MIDYKKLQSNSEDAAVDSPYKPYKQEEKAPDSTKKASQVINAFYADKDQYEAFVRLVGETEAKKWMRSLWERSVKE